MRPRLRARELGLLLVLGALAPRGALAQDAAELERRAQEHQAAGRLRLAADAYRDAYTKSKDVRLLRLAIDAYLLLGPTGKAPARAAAQALMQSASSLEQAEEAQRLLDRIDAAAAVPPSASPAQSEPPPLLPPGAAPPSVPSTPRPTTPTAGAPALPPNAAVTPAVPAATPGARLVVSTTDGRELTGEVSELRWGEYIELRVPTGSTVRLGWSEVLDAHVESQPVQPPPSFKARGDLHLGFAVRGFLIGSLGETIARSEIRPNSGPGYLLQSKVPIGGFGLGASGEISVHYLALPERPKSGLLFGLRAGVGLGLAAVLAAKNEDKKGFTVDGGLGYQVPLFLGGQVLLGSFHDRATWSGAVLGFDLFPAYRKFGVQGEDGSFAFPGFRGTLELMTLKAQSKRDGGFQLALEFTPRGQKRPMAAVIGIGKAWY